MQTKCSASGMHEHLGTIGAGSKHHTSLKQASFAPHNTHTHSCRQQSPPMSKPARIHCWCSGADSQMAQDGTESHCLCRLLRFNLYSVCCGSVLMGHASPERGVVH